MAVISQVQVPLFGRYLCRLCESDVMDHVLPESVKQQPVWWWTSPSAETVSLKMCWPHSGYTGWVFIRLLKSLPAKRKESNFECCLGFFFVFSFHWCWSSFCRRLQTWGWRERTDCWGSQVSFTFLHVSSSTVKASTYFLHSKAVSFILKTEVCAGPSLITCECRFQQNKPKNNRRRFSGRTPLVFSFLTRLIMLQLKLNMCQHGRDNRRKRK